MVIRLTPRADRDAFGGVRTTAEGDALEARVRAVPEDGKANAALMVLLAARLGVGVSSFNLERGATSRLKTIAVSGDPALLAARLAGLNEDHA
jgi:uncharacterized protein YggU (UPF0235/DUF167 family)